MSTDDRMETITDPAAIRATSDERGCCDCRTFDQHERECILPDERECVIVRDEYDEPAPFGSCSTHRRALSSPVALGCTTPAPASGAGLDLGALHETICDKFTGMAEVRQAADLLVAEVRRLVKYRDWWKASSLANAEDVRRLAAICHDWRDRSEAAEAEVRRLTEDIDQCWVPLYHDTKHERDQAEARAESAEAEVGTLRARLAEGRRIVGMLAETVESECENERDICHEHDRTSDGSCALLADLLRARAALATTGEGQ